jgi:hypothetical protein
MLTNRSHFGRTALVAFLVGLLPACGRTVAPRPAESTRSAARGPKPTAPPWQPWPRGIGLRTSGARPLVVYRDGTATLAGAQGVTRVSDHFSACFVTRDHRVACWGIGGGGTWDGVATRDPDVGLEDVRDVAIVQTRACAVKLDGTVWCWGEDGVPEKRPLPAPALEMFRSIDGTACALLDTGSVATWTEQSEPRLVLGDVRHLVGCSKGFICGAKADGRLACTTPPADDSKTSRAERRIFTLAADLRADGGYAMSDYGTALCAWGSDGARCVDAKTQTSLERVSGLPSVVEMALGWAKLGDEDVESVACARDREDTVYCWDLARRTPPAALPRPPKAPPPLAARSRPVPTPPLERWSTEDRERLAIVGALCAPAYAKALEPNGSIEIGCHPNRPDGSPAIAVAHGIHQATVLRGKFRSPSSDDAVVFLELGSQVWLSRNGEVWQVDHRLKGNSDGAECRISRGGGEKDLLVCLAPYTGPGGGRMDVVILPWDVPSDPVLVSLGLALDPWWMLCGGKAAVGPRPSYGVTSWSLGRVDGGADLEIRLVREGWDQKETERLSRDRNFIRYCDCPDEACESRRPSVPREELVLTYARKGDSFVPSPETRKRLAEISHQWDSFRALSK